MSDHIRNNQTMKTLSERQREETIEGPCTTDSMECKTSAPQHHSLGESNKHSRSISKRAPSHGSTSDRMSIPVDFGPEQSQSHEVVRVNAEESNSTTADAFSNSLADSALKASPFHLSDTFAVTGCDSSSSSGGDVAMVTTMSSRSAHRSSSDTSSATNTRTSGSSDDAGMGGSTQRGISISSGDDRDSSRDLGDNGGALSSENSSERMLAQSGALNRGQRRHRHHHHYHHHLHQSPRSNTVPAECAASAHGTSLQRTNDGSMLKLPGDEGSDRLSTGPAIVVASIIPPPNADSSSSSGSGGEGGVHDGLLQPRREPGYHAIRKTFTRFARRTGTSGSGKRAETSSSEENRTKTYIKGKHGYPKVGGTTVDKASKAKKQNKGSKKSPSPELEDSNEPNGEGTSSGSGTEEGYMGSAESKENESSSSPSVSSWEGRRRKSSKRHRTSQDDAKLGALKTEGQDSCDVSSSSEITDFSSGATLENGEDEEGEDFAIDPFQSSSPSISSSNEDEEHSSEDGHEASYLQAKSQILQNQQQHALEATTRKRRAIIEGPQAVKPSPWPRPRIRASSDCASPPILNLGSDIMAHVLTFLEPPRILDVLIMPLSKEWRQTFTLQPELWRVLCLVEPFKAIIDDEDLGDTDDSRSADSFCSLGKDEEGASGSRLLDKYRLLYSSFVRCMKYLSQIREDALNGRAPSYIDCGIAGSNAQQDMLGVNINLNTVLGRIRKGAQGELASEESSANEEPQQVVACVASIPKEDNSKKRKRSIRKSKMEKKLKIGQSMITDRLLGPSASGQCGSLDLPWSCAIYSIVSWMVSFSDVEGIQTLCMQVLPFILENEQQRQTAQRAGLTDVVLRAMVFFPESVHLHIAAFHTIVLLARPLGGREGMLFHSSMILTGIFGGQNNAHPKNGITVMVESMKRFEDNDVLQAMSCWALVNIALAPAQKAELVKLGGIEATSNAMRLHPFSAEVQFRALFALINLVIPSVSINREDPEVNRGLEPTREASHTSEKEMIDESVSDIAALVVRAMTNFCSSEAILNRACLVLHNLSLTREYHSALLWTPKCYQMLEWCLANYGTDQVLQQSATRTLHRLQTTLSNNDGLRAKFSKELQSQQHASLYQAHREALRLRQRQEELNGSQHDAAYA